MTCQIEDCGGDDGIECGGASKVKKSVDTAEADGENRCPDGKIAGAADVGEEVGKWDTALCSGY